VDNGTIDLVCYILTPSSSTALEQYFVSIMQVILTRLQNSKTEHLTLRFVRFYHFISAHDDKGYSADYFIQVTDKVQAEYVKMILCMADF
jgi:exportin-2 (importin alpha re-exporter)